MPIYLDRHEFNGVTAAEIAKLHQRDLAIQQQYGVRFLTYWFDDARGTAFCLIDAPDAGTAMRVHSVAHGDVAAELIEVDLSAVEAFLGRVTQASAVPHVADVGPAHRTIMFTDLVDSTGLAARLGDHRMVEMVRAHDALVRRALKDWRGREVKHTGDGIMASFEGASDAVECACAIQRAFEAFNLGSSEKLRVRVGLDAGEPVEDSADLFGATVQRAARLCQTAGPDTVVISAPLRDLINRPIGSRELGPSRLKGFAEPVRAFEVSWH